MYADRTPTDAANAFKHPVGPKVGDGNTKYDISYVLAHQRYFDWFKVNL